MPSLTTINSRVIRCRKCPELRAYCRQVGIDKRRAYADFDYWARPVPAFGDPDASILIVGLAPGAHGANRTGRMFTGDRSGDFLYAALHRVGIAGQPESVDRDDGLTLHGVYVTAAARCTPPANKPTATQRANCLGYLVEEIAAMRPAVMLCLGGIAWSAALSALRETGEPVPRPLPRFGHGVECEIGFTVLLGSYHVSQQNTFTGRLTETMLDAVLERAIELAQGPILPMQIFITGGTGLVGRRIVLDRLTRGDRVVVLSRDGVRARNLFATDANPNVTVVEGNPASPGAWQEAVDGCDAVIHLAGAGVADRRWTPAYKKLLVQSRVDSTHQVARAIREADDPPRTLVCASAVGYYGDTGDTAVDESGAAGDDFLATLARAWEAQARTAASDRTRVVIVRIGVVLDERGGMLGKLLPMFRLGLGGRWGSGRQYLPWIHWRDVVGLVGFVLEHREADGVYNAAAPDAVPVRVFARALGRALGRPALLPAPGPLLRLAVGEMASAMTMSSRVVPARAEADGYRFLYSEIDDALPSLVGRGGDGSGGDADEPVRVAVADETEPASRPPSPVRLLAIDVSGTLLRRDGTVAGGVVQACRAAERCDCVVVLATSRAPRGLLGVQRALGIVGPTINYNGAVIWNPVDEQSLYHQPLDGALAQEIATESRALHPELLVGVEVLDRAYTDRVDKAFERLTGLVVEPDFIGPLDEAFRHPVTRLDLAGPRDHVDAVASMVRDRYWSKGDVAVFRAGPHVVQVVHPLADKSIALQRIAAKMGLDKSAVMVVGEGDNDLGMLEWSGFAVAVDNARPAAQELADHVVANGDGLGVARAIQRFVLLGSRQ